MFIKYCKQCLECKKLFRTIGCWFSLYDMEQDSKLCALRRMQGIEVSVK